jgi:hypothetical protein
MSMSFTTTATETFTLSHAKHLASKIAADLKRMQRFYGKPSDQSIADYEAEAVALLKAGYFGKASYGFRRNGEFIEPTLVYTARDLQGLASNDDDPGRISARCDVSDATFYSYMTYSSAWSALDSNLQSQFEATLPFVRSGAAYPSMSGYLENDRSYSAGGRALDRGSLRSY